MSQVKEGEGGGGCVTVSQVKEGEGGVGLCHSVTGQRGGGGGGALLFTILSSQTKIIG